MSYGFSSDDAFENAKKRSLTDFLETHLGIKARGKNVAVKARMCSCPACGPSHDSDSVRLRITNDVAWRCYVCGESGSIIDAALQLGCASTPLEAAKYVLGDVDNYRSAPSPAQREKAAQVASDIAVARAEVVKILFRETRNYWSAEGYAYLTRERCFSKQVIENARHLGLIGTMPSYREGGLAFMKAHLGLDLMIRANLYNTEKESSWLASYPLLQFMPGNHFAEARRIWMPPPAEGKKPPLKTLGLGNYAGTHAMYWWEGDRSRCLVTEGFMDVMAGRTMGYPYAALAIPGIAKWDINWFISLHRAGVGIFDLAFDNDVEGKDNRGQIAQATLAAELDKNQIPWSNSSPAVGDLNDHLKRTVRASTMLVT
jgi:hypothetical protein